MENSKFPNEKNTKDEKKQTKWRSPGVEVEDVIRTAASLGAPASVQYACTIAGMPSPRRFIRDPHLSTTTTKSFLGQKMRVALDTTLSPVASSLAFGITAICAHQICPSTRYFIYLDTTLVSRSRLPPQTPYR